MMDRPPRFTPQVAKVLDLLMSNDGLAGADITRATKLKSGYLYPLLFRLEQAGWLKSRWEEGDPSEMGRPRRRLYSVTGVGVAYAREAASQPAALFGRLAAQ
jgi:PadR family transcriptional regulator, regulatory protein PadR